MPFVAYSDLVIAVEDATCDLIDPHDKMRLTHYHEILEENGLSWDTESMRGTDASRLDDRAVMALLLGAAKAERFCNGAPLVFLMAVSFAGFGGLKSWIVFQNIRLLVTRRVR